MSNPWVGDLDEQAAAERASAYSQRFDRLAARGGDVHGEADLVAALVPLGSSMSGGPLILDAGCGTGRVAGRLAEQGYRLVGVDLDAGMLGQARRRYPELTWVESDLADLMAGPEPFDAVVAAGNVMPLLTPGTEAAVVNALATLLRPGGLLIAGFGLDDAHLPPSAPTTARFRSLDRYDQDCSAAGLQLRNRWATWDREAFNDGDGDGDGDGSGDGSGSRGGYAVSVHVRDQNVPD